MSRTLLTRLPALVIGFALVVGLAFRLYPVLAGQPLLAQFLITEDGYLLLTVARNMALGLGMTVSEGTIATNGVQPLITFLFSAAYLVTGADRVTSLVGVHLIMAAIGVGALFAIRAFAARLLAGFDQVRLWAACVAALWFLGSVTARHSMNALETGLITLMIVLTLLQFHRVIEKGPEATRADRLWLGALAGIAFLARIDAALFCIALWGVWMLDVLIRQRASFGGMLVQLVPPGIVCLIVAAPWLLNNQLRFGSLMPSSGTAQSLNNAFGENVVLLPSRIFEYLFPMLPVPASLETALPAVIAFALVIVLVLGLFVIRVLQTGSPAIRAVVIVYLIHALVLSYYYGVTFGAAHFLTRYLAPLAPLLIVAALWAALEIGRWALAARPGLLAGLYGLGGVALSTALLVRLTLPGVSVQGHFQVVDWVHENVPEETWVGAVQTGTLGYWHDRTINLDGKVNPDALAARIEHGNVLPYVVASEIDYVVDWASVGNWASRSDGGYSDEFELIVEDFDIDLSVQRRIAAE